MAADAIGKKMKRTSGAAWLDRESRVCPCCKKDFIQRRHNQKTCGAGKCQSEYKRERHKSTTEVSTCEACGKEFTRYVNSYATRTCSIECSHRLRKRTEAARLAQTAPRKCVICDKEYRSSNKQQMTCGKRKCINAYNTLHQRNRRHEQRISAYSEPFDIDFSSLHTLSAEFPTMDCTECDPLTNRDFNGVWIETHEHKPARKAA